MEAAVAEKTESKYKNTNLAKIIEFVNSSDISSVKSVVSGLIAIIKDPKSTARDLKELIQIDPPLSGKILKVSNSAYYASQAKIDALEKAIIWLGYNTVGELVLRQKTSELFSNIELTAGFTSVELWKYSVSVAQFSKMIFRREFREKGDGIYTSGLLHKIGLITEIQVIHKSFLKIFALSQSSNISLLATEQKQLGFDHAELGMHITRSWSLPESINMAIAYQANPFKAVKEHFRNAATIYISSALCRLAELGYYEAMPYDEIMFNKCLAALNMTRDGVELIMEEGKLEIQAMIEKGAL